MLNDEFNFNMMALELLMNSATMEVTDHIVKIIVSAVEDAADDSSELNARKTQIYRGVIKGLSEQIDRIEGFHVE